ncbi:hypothetical protein [Flavobacterium collinsii]|uniref:Uncharacterized protein n=1 Tax=Flavobacterium collinsii TaxID=1114861 RepID=A0ABM8KQB7_9FLAO|nr:hypothetical protein [Flavobacterium collinsii]CAA9203490.1 hypothetical protein FLACOL7796_04754 [Flavobacterium collinsii]
MITHLQAEANDSIDQLWFKTLKECEQKHKVQNLVISGTFPITELNNPFILEKKELAELWQLPSRPNTLKFNHGEYLNKNSKSALTYLIDELRIKNDSNRACWSLIDMDILIGSGDTPIPSFLVLQAGISDDNKTLSITCYYRALEIKNFLPINLAEICLIASEINNAFGNKFDNITITIHAFNAYVKDNFTCLSRAKLDTFTEAEIATKIAVIGNGPRWIKDVLDEKKDHLESNIEIIGINNLISSIKLYIKENRSELYSQEFLNLLEEVASSIRTFNNIVKNSSYDKKSTEQYEIIKSNIANAIAKI